MLLTTHSQHRVLYSESLRASHKLRPNPHAARALALLAPTPQLAWASYLEGWAALQPTGSSVDGAPGASGAFGDSSTDPIRDAVMDSLVREMCEFCRATGMLPELRSFLATVKGAELRRSDAVQYSTALLAMNSSDWKTAMSTISNNCWPVYVGSQHLVSTLSMPRCARPRFRAHALASFVASWERDSRPACVSECSHLGVSVVGAGAPGDPVGGGNVRAVCRRGGSGSGRREPHATARAEGATEVPAAAEYWWRWHRRLMAWH